MCILHAVQLHQCLFMSEIVDYIVLITYSVNLLTPDDAPLFSDCAAKLRLYWPSPSLSRHNAVWDSSGVNRFVRVQFKKTRWSRVWWETWNMKELGYKFQVFHFIDRLRIIDWVVCVCLTYIHCVNTGRVSNCAANARCNRIYPQSFRTSSTRERHRYFESNDSKQLQLSCLYV